MGLTPEEVDHVAFLARLDLTPGERDAFTEQLGKVLDWMGQLQEVDLEGAEVTYGRTNVFREDVPHEPLGAEAVLANAPAREGDHFRIPRILEEA